MDSETFEQLVARVNTLAFVPPPNPTGAIKMAKQVKLGKGKEFTFSLSGGRTASKYPWDEWFSGNLLLLERSSGTEDDKGTITEVSEKRDYEVGNDAMLPKIKTAARRRYKVVQTSRVDADGNRLKDAIIIKARDMTAEERQDEDMLRVDEKEALKAKKATAKASVNGAVSHPEPASVE